MIVRYDRDKQNVPLKMWFTDEDLIENSALEQALNATKLPFLYKHVALMPDAHTGYGVPIGCVFGADGYVVPNAVGVDIGCGMLFCETNIDADRLINTETPNGKLGQKICGDIRRDVPVGFHKHDEPHPSDKTLELDQFFDDVKADYGIESLEDEYHESKCSLGTLGGGNHFIELQRDTRTGNLCIMIHSGSRHFGYTVAKYFNNLAEEKNDLWCSKAPNNLNFLPVNDKTGLSYLHWMNLALLWSDLNKVLMLEEVKKSLRKEFNNLELGDIVDTQHNYVALENIKGKDVYVHRKGAIRVREDEKAIIPGAMGSRSFIVRGKQNPESFHSASHGVGRKMSRTQAKEDFTVEEMVQDLKDRDVILSTPYTEDTLDEYRKAYKPVSAVMYMQGDLVSIARELETVCVIKG